MTKAMKRILLLLMVLFFVHSAIGQNPYVKKPFTDRLLIEGVVGLQIGMITAIELSPLFGYKVTDDFITGIGFTYQYSRYKNFYLNTENNQLEHRKVNILGSRVFARYLFKDWFEGLGILSGLFAHSEFEYLIYSRNFKYDNNGRYVDIFGIRYEKGTQQVDAPGVLIGGGLMQPIGGRAYASILVLYNLNETKDTPYRNPIFRMGIGFGI
jgi:hypothetical protein